MINWLRSLFSSQPDLPPIDLSVLRTDMHSHLIPAIDDGSKDLDDSVAMIRRFSELGYQKVVTTPHVMSDFYKNTPEIINEGLEKVRARLKQEGISVEIEAAAEYYLDEALEQLIKDKNLLTFGDNYVLFELPFVAEPPNLNSIIFDLQTQGYKPVLAHPERYGFWYNDFDKYLELHDKGVLLQLNILSLIGHYSPETKKIAERLVKEGVVSFLGSDCHHLHHLELIEIARKMPALHELLESGKLKNNSL